MPKEAFFTQFECRWTEWLATANCLTAIKVVVSVVVRTVIATAIILVVVRLYEWSFY